MKKGFEEREENNIPVDDDFLERIMGVIERGEYESKAVEDDNEDDFEVLQPLPYDGEDYPEYPDYEEHTQAIEDTESVKLSTAVKIIRKIIAIPVGRRAYLSLLSDIFVGGVVEEFDRLQQEEKDKIHSRSTTINSFLPWILLIIGNVFGSLGWSDNIAWLCVLSGVGWYCYTSVLLPFGMRNYPIYPVRNEYKKLGLSSQKASYELPKALYKHYQLIENTLRVDILNSSEIYIDKTFGLVQKLNVEQITKTVRSKTLSDVELNRLYLLPVLRNAGREGVYLDNGELYLMLDLVFMHEIDKVRIDIQGLFNEKAVMYANIFSDLRHIAEEQERYELALAKEREEAEFRESIEQATEGKGLNEKAVNILMSIRRNKDSLGCNFWNNSPKAITGNKNYMRVNMRLNTGVTFKDINSRVARLEKIVGYPTSVEQSHYKGGFEMMVLFKPQLKAKKKSFKNILELNKQGQIYLGEGLGGDMITTLSDNAQFMGFFGKSGSGKTATGLLVVPQFLNAIHYVHNLNEDGEEIGKPTEVHIMSDSKVADFSTYKGLASFHVQEKAVHCLDKLLSEFRRREEVFAKHNTNNIYAYNKKMEKQGKRDKKMPMIAMIFDELETAMQNTNKVSSTDKRKIGEAIEDNLVSIANICRSSGGLMFVFAQNYTKSGTGIGRVRDKITTTVLGNSDNNVLSTLHNGGEMAKYFNGVKSTQGVFFYNSANNKILGETIEFMDTGYSLVQVPWVDDVSKKYLPPIMGAEQQKYLESGDNEVESEEEDEERLTIDLIDLDKARVTERFTEPIRANEDVREDFGNEIKLDLEKEPSEPTGIDDLI